MEFDGKESAAALKAKSRKTVILPEAQVPILIRKLVPRDFVSGLIAANANLDIPAGSITVNPNETEEQAKTRARVQAMQNNPATLNALAKTIFDKGVLAPRILLDDEAIAGDGEVNAWDFVEKDLKWLMTQIIEFSGLGAEAQAVESFREGEAPNDDGSGSAGETIRDAAASTS